MLLHAAAVIPSGDEGIAVASDNRSADFICSCTGVQLTGTCGSGATSSDAGVRTGETGFFANDIASLSYDIKSMSYV